MSFETKAWRDCLQPFDYNATKAMNGCKEPKAAFHACIERWREANATVVANGESAKFAAPFECRAIVDMYQCCLERAGSDTTRCCEWWESDLNECRGRHATAKSKESD